MRFWNRKKKDVVQTDVRDQIKTRLSAAKPGALNGTNEIVAVAILSNAPQLVSGEPLGEARKVDGLFAEELLLKYQKKDNIPANLSVRSKTPVAIRRYGDSAGAPLDFASVTDLCASVLADLTDVDDLDDYSVLAFRSVNISMDLPGVSYFAVLAR